MAIVGRSNLAPSILVEFETSQDYIDYERALGKLKEGSGGETLLKEIERVSVDGKEIKVVIDKTEMSLTRPMLTKKQAEQWGFKWDDNSRLENIQAGTYASVKDDGTRNVGTSVLTKWNPEYGAMAYSIKGYVNVKVKNTNFVSLAHELLHGLLFLQGRSKGDLMSDFSDKNSPNGKEEMRVIGYGPYSGVGITENTIRAEHGIQLRLTY